MNEKHFAVHIDSDPKKHLLILKMIIKNASLFGPEALLNAKNELHNFRFSNSGILYIGEPLYRLELPIIGDPAKEIFVTDWCKNHGIEYDVMLE